MEATHMVLPLESIQVAFLNNLVTLDTITVLNIKVHSFMALAISILLVPLSIPLGEPPIQKVAKTQATLRKLEVLVIIIQDQLVRKLWLEMAEPQEWVKRVDPTCCIPLIRNRMAFSSHMETGRLLGIGIEALKWVGKLDHWKRWP